MVFGVENGGSNTRGFVDQLSQYDVADITNKISRYVEYQFTEFDVIPVQRGRSTRPALLVFDATVLLPFVRPGTYDVGGGRQKTAFSQGTVYFRHGGKSEPGKRDDFLAWRDRELERVRQDWVGNLRKVIEAPLGQTVSVITAQPPRNLDGAVVRAQIAVQPGAQAVVPANPEEIWPHRQKAVIERVNRALLGQIAITTYDIQCIKNVFNVLEEHPEFAFKPHPIASPQYSDQFIEWILNQYRRNEDFFAETRREYQR